MKTWVKPGIETLEISKTSNDPGLKSFIATDEDVNNSVAGAASVTDESSNAGYTGNEQSIPYKTVPEPEQKKEDSTPKETEIMKPENEQATEPHLEGDSDEQATEPHSERDSDCAITESNDPVPSDKAILNEESTSIFAEEDPIFGEENENSVAGDELQIGGGCEFLTEDEELNDKLMKMLLNS